jgi:hypothetical protein
MSQLVRTAAQPPSEMKPERDLWVLRTQTSKVALAFRTRNRIPITGVSIVAATSRSE